MHDNSRFVLKLASGHELEWAIDFLRGMYSPEEIFTEKELIEWAESKGFVKKIEEKSK